MLFTICSQQETFAIYFQHDLFLTCYLFLQIEEVMIDDTLINDPSIFQVSVISQKIPVEIGRVNQVSDKYCQTQCFLEMQRNYDNVIKMCVNLGFW